MQLAYAKPDLYLMVPVDERERRCWGNETDYFQIEQDGEYKHFIRGWLPIPVQDRDAPFAWGIWVEVPRERFFRYLDLYKVDGSSEHPFSAVMATQVEGYPATTGLAVQVQLVNRNERPVVTVAEPNHPLRYEQAVGITSTRVMEILHRFQAKGS